MTLSKACAQCLQAACGPSTPASTPRAKLLQLRLALTGSVMKYPAVIEGVIGPRLCSCAPTGRLPVFDSCRAREGVIRNWWRLRTLRLRQSILRDGRHRAPEEDHVPTLIMHGGDDQVVSFADSAPLTAKRVKNATLKAYRRFPHGMCTTHAERVNADLAAAVHSITAAGILLVSHPAPTPTARARGPTSEAAAGIDSPPGGRSSAGDF
jgi:pimeloyl-ACP methyl ester carboxylesterase